MCPPSVAITHPADTPDPWQQAVRLADAQGGAVDHAQLRGCGLSPSAIAWRCKRRDLVRRHRGVYILGRATLTAFGENCAASLAAGKRGALGLWSAAAAVGIGAWPATPQLIVVGGGLDLKDVDVRRTRQLRTDETVTNATGIRATHWPRIPIDLAEDSSVAELQTVIDNLERAHLLDVGVLRQAMKQANGKTGLRKLNCALEPFTTIPEAEYLSLLERFTAMVLQPAGLPAEINGRVTLQDGQTVRVDVLLREQRIAIEVDGRDSHDRSLQFATDRYRDRELQKLGYRVLRFTWQDVMYRPEQVLRDIRAVLATPASRR